MWPAASSSRMPLPDGLLPRQPHTRESISSIDWVAAGPMHRSFFCPASILLPYSLTCCYLSRIALWHWNTECSELMQPTDASLAPDGEQQREHNIATLGR